MLVELLIFVALWTLMFVALWTGITGFEKLISKFNCSSKVRDFVFGF
jgi:hypothetical protein